MYFLQRSRVPLLAGLGLFYFAFHMLHGDHGLVGRSIELRKQEQLQRELTEIKAQRVRMEHNIALLNGEQIDGDLLGELARSQLSMVGKNEVMIIAK
jgi:cell division protein FtsB